MEEEEEEREGPLLQLLSRSLSSVSRSLKWGGAGCLDKEPGMLITCLSVPIRTTLISSIIYSPEVAEL